jgi:NADPH-dependent glutamate synthase beta subunit-like oxidoreductase
MSAPKYRTLVPDIEFWMRMIPCQAACPVKTDAGKYVQLIAEGQFKESYLVARSPNPFASVCGRVCAAPCEDACRRGRIDAPITIRALKRFVTEKYGVESMEPDTQDDCAKGSEMQATSGAGTFQ